MLRPSEADAHVGKPRDACAGRPWVCDPTRTPAPDVDGLGHIDRNRYALVGSDRQPSISPRSVDLTCPDRREAAVFSRSLPAGVDHRRHGAGASPGTPRSRAELRPGRRQDRLRLAADRAGTTGDDVPGAGEGPLRRDPPDHRRSPPDGPVAGAQLGGGTGADVRPGLGLPARPARLPHRVDHRGARAVHRDGADLERPRLRRPGGRRGVGGHQLGVPSAGVLGARLVLPGRAAGLAGPAHGVRGLLVLGDLRLGAGVPGDSFGGRLPDPLRR